VEVQTQAQPEVPEAPETTSQQPDAPKPQQQAEVAQTVTRGTQEQAAAVAAQAPMHRGASKPAPEKQGVQPEAQRSGDKPQSTLAGDKSDERFTQAPAQTAAAQSQPQTQAAAQAQVAVTSEVVEVKAETPQAPADSTGAEAKATTEVASAAEQSRSVETPKASQPATPPRVDVEQFVDRLVRFARVVSGRVESSVEMRLNPPELGSVKLSMSVREGELRMAMQTTTEAARQVISQNISQLRAALTAQGFAVGQMDVEVGHSFADAQTFQEQQSGRSAPTPRAYAAETEVTPDEAPPRWIGNGMGRYLNLVA
jgi:flagellar hook-length control protein FliK